MLIICLKLFLHFLQLVFHWWLGHDFFLARWKAGKIARKNVDKWVVWILHRCEKQSYCRYCGKHCFETWKNSYSYCDVSCLSNWATSKRFFSCLFKVWCFYHKHYKHKGFLQCEAWCLVWKWSMNFLSQKLQAKASFFLCLFKVFYCLNFFSQTTDTLECIKTFNTNYKDSS